MTIYFCSDLTPVKMERDGFSVQLYEVTIVLDKEAVIMLAHIMPECM